MLEPRSEIEDLGVQSYLDEPKKYWLGLTGWGMRVEYLSTGLEVFGYFGQFGHYSQLPIECSWYEGLAFFVLYEENQWKWSCEDTGFQEQKVAYITCQAETSWYPNKGSSWVFRNWVSPELGGRSWPLKLGLSDILDPG